MGVLVFEHFQFLAGEDEVTTALVTATELNEAKLGNRGSARSRSHCVCIRALRGNGLIVKVVDPGESKDTQLGQVDERVDVFGCAWTGTTDDEAFSHLLQCKWNAVKFFKSNSNSGSHHGGPVVGKIRVSNVQFPKVHKEWKKLGHVLLLCFVVEGDVVEAWRGPMPQYTRVSGIYFCTPFFQEETKVGLASVFAIIYDGAHREVTDHSRQPRIL